MQIELNFDNLSVILITSKHNKRILFPKCFTFKTFFRNYGLASGGNVKNSGIFMINYNNFIAFIHHGVVSNCKRLYRNNVSNSTYFVVDTMPFTINPTQKFEEVFNLDKNQQKVTNQVSSVTTVGILGNLLLLREQNFLKQCILITGMRTFLQI